MLLLTMIVNALQIISKIVKRQMKLANKLQLVHKVSRKVSVISCHSEKIKVKQMHNTKGIRSNNIRNEWRCLVLGLWLLVAKDEWMLIDKLHIDQIHMCGHPCQAKLVMSTITAIIKAEICPCIIHHNKQCTILIVVVINK